MATYAEISSVPQILTNVNSNIQQIAKSFKQLESAIASAVSGKATLTTVATDTGDAPLAAAVATITPQLAEYLKTELGAANVQGIIERIAQIHATFSEFVGLEGTANELRITRGGAVVPVTQDA
jgi:capsular polysaccharide biosynthesis protein